ncbi:MAG: tRNA (adenosine(37)-N6)-dimethylallyltransferase MiaA [Candidatus Yanofskybacteria bacterium]|nr:tRNA (adenosine(37)-N6)-dimethylallyltransferase MiaA [Candidatus Yanofskybacteria bacterium]
MLKNNQSAGRDKIVVIVGSTASGKTALSLEIAKWFNGEIISADSRQIYRGMNVGTAKPSENELKQIRHYLIDIKNPNQDYSAGQYKKDALAAIMKILKAGRLPIIVGGTGLYTDVIVKNLDMPEVKENKKLRARLEKDIETKGLDFVFNKLIELDAEAAYIVDPRNPRRIIRAMEIALLTGRPFSAQRKSGPPLFDFLQIGLKLPPEILKEKIQKRTKIMIKNGLVDEVRGLVRKCGYTLKAFDAIGYREIIDCLKNLITPKEAEDLINKNTWHYARRQMTWFKRNSEIYWFDNNQKSAKAKIIKKVSKFLEF